MKRIVTCLLVTATAFCCRSQRPDPADLDPVAFPTAEGFGKFTSGGRGGKVYRVSTLEDEGSGSFREAAEANGKRTIVFAVSGIIHLKSELRVRGNVSIFGQTAPGDGICFADYPVVLGGDNVIVQYLRFRLGDRYQNKGQVPGSGHDDAFTANNRKNVIIDHCSFSWSTDEVLSVYNGDSVTLQWNIISEPLNYSYHFEKGDKDFENHGYGGIWGGAHLTAHHNLFTHCVSRNPRFAGVRSGGRELVDYRNNVIYNWGGNNVYGGEGGEYNIVNNYYKYGPATKKSVMNRIVNPTQQARPFISYGKFYVAGNFVDGAPDVTNNNRLGVHMGENADPSLALVSSLFPVVPIRSRSAEQAYAEVLEGAGVSHRRDTLDQRIINDVTSRTGRIIDVQGGYPHGTPYEQTRSAWPQLNAGTMATDTDGDGMPDNWELLHGLDLLNGADASVNSKHPFYTNIELYVHSLTNARK